MPDKPPERIWIDGIINLQGRRSTMRNIYAQPPPEGVPDSVEYVRADILASQVAPPADVTPEMFVYQVAQRDSGFRRHLIEQLTALGDKPIRGPLKPLPPPSAAVERAQPEDGWCDCRCHNNGVGWKYQTCVHCVAAEKEKDAETRKLIQYFEDKLAELRTNHAAEKEKVWDKAIAIAQAVVNEGKFGYVTLERLRVAALEAARTADIKEK